jgi:hypothetical protein
MQALPRRFIDLALKYGFKRLKPSRRTSSRMPRAGPTMALGSTLMAGARFFSCVRSKPAPGGACASYYLLAIISARVVTYPFAKCAKGPRTRIIDNMRPILRVFLGHSALDMMDGIVPSSSEHQLHFRRERQSLPTPDIRDSRRSRRSCILPSKLTDYRLGPQSRGQPQFLCPERFPGPATISPPAGLGEERQIRQQPERSRQPIVPRGECLWSI